MYKLNNNSGLATLICDDFVDFRPMISKNLEFSNLNFVITIHVFYEDIFEEILESVKNIKFANPSLLISTDTQEKINFIKKILDKTNFNYSIKIFKNIGRDIAPSFIGFKTEILESEYFLHIHTKKSEYNPVLSRWRKDIMIKLLGSERIARSNMGLLIESKIGVLIPEPPDFIIPHMNWGTKSDLFLTKSLLRKSKINISKFNPLYFPAGSMFFARTESIKTLINNLDIASFDEESGQISGTMAHAVERSILFFVEYIGKEWLVVGCSGNREPLYKSPKYKLLKNNIPMYIILKLKLLKRTIKDKLKSTIKL